MNLIPTHEFPSLSIDLVIGWDKIQVHDSIEIPFVDRQFLEKNLTDKRKNEHLSARKLFGNLLNEVGIGSETVKLKKMELGKPYAENGQQRIFTSFSHCDDWVVCSLSKTLDIGVDCESLERKMNPRILDRILDKSEKSILKELSHLAIWAMKEAVVKCIGTGIRTSLQKYPLRKAEDGYFVEWENDRIKIVPFIWENHQLAVAWRE